MKMRARTAVFAIALAAAIPLASADDDCVYYEDHLRWVGSLHTPGTAADVAVSGDFAYLADGSMGFKVFDISDLQHPVVIGEVGTP